MKNLEINPVYVTMVTYTGLFCCMISKNDNVDFVVLENMPVKCINYNVSSYGLVSYIG